MKNENGYAAYSVLSNVADDLIMDALLPEGRAAAPVKMKKERLRLLAFLESGWGVAIICALVAVSVMGGIIWAGNQTGPVTPPAGTVESEDAPTSPPTELPPDAESVVEVWDANGSYAAVGFFVWSEDVTEYENGMGEAVNADGWGFIGTMEYSNKMPELPEVSYDKSADSTDPYGLAIKTGFVIERIAAYDMDLNEVLSTVVDEDWNYGGFMSFLENGRYYISVYVTHREGSHHRCGRDYAFIADVGGLLKEPQSTEMTDKCTIRTRKERYEWGEEKLATYTVELTCTVAGAILDISEYDFELVNLDTGKQATMIYLKISVHFDTSKAYPKAPDAFAQDLKTFRFDWATTPPGRYRLTYKGMELTEGEEYPYCDFEIYTPEPRMAVWDGDNYVIPAEALRWTETWDDASQTMIGSESPGWGDIPYLLKYHLLEAPVMDVAPDADVRVVGAEITYCEIYRSDGEMIYQGDSWEAAMECVLKTPTNTACYVVFTADWQGDYVPEANAYEGRAYEYAFCLVVRDR